MHLGAELGEQLDQGADVLDVRDVVEHDLLVRQERGGEDRQRGVLVAGRSNRALQRTAAVDHEFRHGFSPRRHPIERARRGPARNIPGLARRRQSAAGTRNTVLTLCASGV